MKLQRIFAPLIFWTNLLVSKMRGLFRPRVKELVVPSELMPLLAVGTLSMKYCEFMEIEPEDLKLSQKLHEVVDGTADTDTMIFVEKVLFGKDLFNTVFDWLVFLKDAIEPDRELFRAYLTLPPQNEQK